MDPLGEAGVLPTKVFIHYSQNMAFLKADIIYDVQQIYANDMCLSSSSVTTSGWSEPCDAARVWKKINLYARVYVHARVSDQG